MRRVVQRLAQLLRRKSTQREKIKLRPVDGWLLATVLFLTIFGLLMVYDSSVAIAIRDFADKYYFLREQFRWFVVGIMLLFLFSFIDYHWWYKFAIPMLLSTLVLLVAVFLPGIGLRAQGAARWIRTGLFVFQPAELAKLSLCVYLAAWFSNREKGRMLAFLWLIVMVVGLVVLEPDLGTAAVILLTAVVIYFLAGAPIWHLLMLVPVGVLALAGLAVISPYRLARLTTFLNPSHDPLGASYQIRQILLGLGSGGWLGLGLGKSRQKYHYLPEANTDSIFAVIGEEIGFIGALVIIGCFLFLIWRGLRIARKAPDNFGKLLSAGISIWIAIQTAINLSAMVALVPLTGVPLPLISYGGSSLIITLSALGIVLNISRHL